MAKTGINWNRSPNEGTPDSLNNVIGTQIDRIAALEASLAALAVGGITNAMIADGAVTDAKVNAAAAIAGTKLAAPKVLASGNGTLDGGAQLIVTTALVSDQSSDGHQSVAQGIALNWFNDAGAGPLYVLSVISGVSFTIASLAGADAGKKVAWILYQN